MNDQGSHPSPVARRIEWGVRLHEMPLLVGLLLLWMMLWQTFSLLSLASGMLVAVVVMRVFYLPPVELAGRFNLWWALRYLGFFLLQLAVASCQVAWLAVRPGQTPQTAIVAVTLHTRSDFILTIVGLTSSLIPGSLVIDIDRFNSTLYLHVLNAPTQTALTQTRRETLHIERLLIMAVGSRDEMRAIQ